MENRDVLKAVDPIVPLVTSRNTQIDNFPTDLGMLLAMNGKYHIILHNYELLLIA